MSYTARQLPNTYHVSYGPTFSVQSIALPLQTEAGLDIMTETSQTIFVELSTGILSLKAHRIGATAFRASGVQST